MAIIDRIKFDGLASREWLVYKHPSETLVYGSQLIVGEGQIAVFVCSGQVYDMFTAGTYTLKAKNLPLLHAVLNLPFGGKTPFTAEIFYFNQTAKLDITWGTNDPILLIDPKYQVRLHVRAFGQVAMKLKDCQQFLREVVGALPASDYLNFTRLQQYFRGVIVQKIKVLIAKIIIDHKISALEITPRLDEIAQAVQKKIKEEIGRYGIEVLNFLIQSINFPDEDFDAINAILAKRAEFEIMGEQRYATARTFDVYEGAANNQSGAAGAMVAGGVGLGAGVALGTQMPLMANAATAGLICPACQMRNLAGARFCVGCGTPMAAPAAVARKCPFCQVAVSENARFCPECGKNIAKPQCPDCGTENLVGAKFCCNCGKGIGQ